MIHIDYIPCDRNGNYNVYDGETLVMQFSVTNAPCKILAQYNFIYTPKIVITTSSAKDCKVSIIDKE